MQTKIEKKLHEIADALFGEMNKGTLAVDNIGLYDGAIGIIIFCKHFLDHFPNQIREKLLDRYIESFFELLVSRVEHFSYCSGLTGVFDGLRYLNSVGLLKVNYSDIECNYKKHLQEGSIKLIAHNNYDFLHGGIGCIKYFANDSRFVNIAFETLENTATVDGIKYKWLSQINLKGDYGYNISLAHGSSSIVSVLSGLTSLDINLDLRDRIVRNACNYILSQQIDPCKFGCFFPSISLESEGSAVHRSRMGWCYGDLGISTSLWQAGKLLKNQDLRDKAIEICTHSARRRDYNDCGIFDFGLCHGTASLCMMFHYMYLQTGNKIFRDTRDYWVASTLDMGHLEGGLAGYRAWSVDEQGYVNEYGLLEGISGIGLMLLTVLSNSDTKAKWMNFFMLN